MNSVCIRSGMQYKYSVVRAIVILLSQPWSNLWKVETVEVFEALVHLTKWMFIEWSIIGMTAKVSK